MNFTTLTYVGDQVYLTNAEKPGLWGTPDSYDELGRTYISDLWLEDLSQGQCIPLEKKCRLRRQSTGHLVYTPLGADGIEVCLLKDLGQ